MSSFETKTRWEKNERKKKWKRTSGCSRERFWNQRRFVYLYLECVELSIRLRDFMMRLRRRWRARRRDNFFLRSKNKLTQRQGFYWENLLACAHGIRFSSIWIFFLMNVRVPTGITLGNIFIESNFITTAPAIQLPLASDAIKIPESNRIWRFGRIVLQSFHLFSPQAIRDEWMEAIYDIL